MCQLGAVRGADSLRVCVCRAGLCVCRESVLLTSGLCLFMGRSHRGLQRIIILGDTWGEVRAQGV